MSVYSVELEWYNEDEDNVFRPTESFYFDCAEAALDFADNIVTDKYEYENIIQAFFESDVIDIELFYDNIMLAINYEQAKKYDIKKYVDEIKFQHLKSLLYSSIFYAGNKEEIDAKVILKENTKILEKIKVELKDK